jgi:hypothetical protein
MGLFDFLFGKTKQPRADASAGAEPTGPRMPSLAEWEDMDGGARARWLGAELEQVKALCEKAGVRISPDLGKAELRGTHGGRPIAVTLDDDCNAELTVKFINRRGHLTLGAPIPGISDRAPADEGFWSDDNDLVAPIVGQSVALLATSKTIEESQAVWDGLAPDARQRVLAWMADGLGHHHVVARHQALESVELCGPRYQLAVVDRVMRSLAELIALAELFAEGEAAILPSGAGPAWTPEKRTCSYCSTTFFLEANDTRCPACGANA